jgi:D-xylose transport system ATP-binding protein
VLREFGLDVDPRSRMRSLDLATQQLVVIARALSKRARLLILDEPTAALTESEAQRLFERMRGLRERGVACMFVSHRLAEVFAIADRVLVMRDGRLRGDHQVGATTREAIVAEMIGGSLAELRTPTPPLDRPVLEIANLSLFDPENPARKRVDDVSFTLRAGEILGLFGLIGAGCTTTAMALFGAWPGKREGTIRIDGRHASLDTPGDAIGRGIGLLAQDRRATLIQDHSLADNLVLASLPDISPHGFIDRDRKELIARQYIQTLSIRAQSADAHISTLSGGNQQKVQVGRWLAAGSRILLLVDPTRGVDVGARAEINRLWQQLAEEGYSLLLVSSEAEELIEICHRILVMRNGQIVSEVAGESATERQLLSIAAGV